MSKQTELPVYEYLYKYQGSLSFSRLMNPSLWKLAIKVTICYASNAISVRLMILKLTLVYKKSVVVSLETYLTIRKTPISKVVNM